MKFSEVKRSIQLDENGKPVKDSNGDVIQVEGKFYAKVAPNRRVVLEPGDYIELVRPTVFFNELLAKNIISDEQAQQALENALKYDIQLILGASNKNVTKLEAAPTTPTASGSF